MEYDKKVIISIDSLNSWKIEDCKKINLLKSICKYYDYTCHVYTDDVDIDDDDDIDDIIDDESSMASIEIECCLNKVEKLVEIFKDFDIYISSVDYMDYHYDVF